MTAEEIRKQALALPTDVRERYLAPLVAHVNQHTEDHQVYMLEEYVPEPLRHLFPRQYAAHLGEWVYWVTSVRGLTWT